MASFTLRRRRPRFTVEELKALVSAVEKVKPVLYGAKITVLNSEVREHAWEEISTAVNAVSQVKRATSEIKKKWADWSSVVKKKNLEMAQRSVEHQGTVTISSKFITPTERRLLAILDTRDLENDSDITNAAMATLKQESNTSCHSESNMEEGFGFGEHEQDSVSNGNLAYRIEKAKEASSPNAEQHGLHSESVETTDVASHSQTLAFHNPNDEFLDETNCTATQNEMGSGISQRNRIVKHSDVLLALKRKKLRVLEEHLKVEKERLEVERGILHILKEMRGTDDKKCGLV